MRKIILLIFCSLIFVQNVVANEQQEIQFVYINGSNNNDVKMKTWFFEGVYKLHSRMYDSFFSFDFIYKNLLKNGEYNISSSPEIFFWGDRSNEEIQALNSDLSFTKVFSPRLAQTVRTLLAHYLHDAIWVSHYRNMHPVVEDLHKQVMENYSNNKSVILFGYSAGAFVTYEYMFNKLADIKAKTLIIAINQDQYFPPELDGIPMSKMIENSTLIRFDSELGHVGSNEIYKIEKEIKEFMDSL